MSADKKPWPPFMSLVNAARDGKKVRHGNFELRWGQEKEHRLEIWANGEFLQVVSVAGEILKIAPADQWVISDA